MANHGFITFRKKIDGNKMAELLDEINRQRFGGYLKISRDNKGWDGKPTFGIEIYPNFQRIFFLPKPNKIEHRHGGGGNFAWWVDSVFSNDLALALNGTISDEGVGEKWKGKPNLYPTFEDYQDDIWRVDRRKRDKPGSLQQVMSFIEAEMEEIEKIHPKLRPFLRKKGSIGG